MPKDQSRSSADVKPARPATPAEQAESMRQTIQKDYNWPIVSVYRLRDGGFIDLFNWLKDLMHPRFSEEMAFPTMDVSSGKARVYLYTRRYVYHFTARLPGDNEDNGYLGGGMSCRAARPGEKWTRGADLPDGPYCRGTFDSIVRSMIRHELIPVDENVRQFCFGEGKYNNQEE